MREIRTWQEYDPDLEKMCPGTNGMKTCKLMEVTPQEFGLKSVDEFLDMMGPEGLQAMMKTATQEENFELCEKIKTKLNKNEKK